MITFALIISNTFGILMIIDMDTTATTFIVEGTMAGNHYDGKNVYLTDPFSEEIFAETVVKDKKFSFHFPDNSLKIYKLVYKYSDKDMFPLTLPIVGGEGNVQVYMGGKVLTTGTPSNDAIQDFLLSNEKIVEEITTSGLSLEEVKTRFKDFLVDTVKNNKDNIVSIYVMKAYASRFTKDEISSLLTLIKSDIAMLY